MSPIDALVVGAGPSAAHAAERLADEGLRVVVVDAGLDAERPEAPPGAFERLRRADPEQQRYFLGRNLEGLPLGPVRVGAQLTPPRQHIAADADALAPSATGAFQALQGFVLGGLGSAWGASTMPFVDADLRRWTLSRNDLQSHYETVARRVGVAGRDDDDLAARLGPTHPLLPPAPIDANGRAILSAYRKRRAALNERGLVVGAPRLAMATRRHAGRGPLRGWDMEFWGDADDAVYRPGRALQAMADAGRIELRRGLLALEFAETGAGVRLKVEDRRTGERSDLRAKRLVLAAGTLGTTRIVARSLGWWGRRLPLRSNPYTYLPGILPGRIGRPGAAKRHSLTQAAMLFDAPTGATLQPQAYSYRSLLLFKLAKESPLAVRESIPLLQAISEALVVIGVFHPDEGREPAARVRLRQGAEGAGDLMEIEPAPPDPPERRAADRAFARLLPRLGVLPLHRIDPGPGASIHYAGTLPMDGLDVDAACRLRAAPRVYLADGATFPTLPSKGLTFTLMANADRVALRAAEEFAASGGRG